MDIYVNNDTRMVTTLLEIGIHDAFRKHYGTSVSIKIHVENHFKFVTWTRWHVYISHVSYMEGRYFRIQLLDTYYNRGETHICNIERVNDLTSAVEHMLHNIEPDIYIDTDIASTYPDINFYKEMFKEENNMAYFNYNNFDHIDPPQAVKDQSRHKTIQAMEIILGIRDVKFNDPATIVFWDDGTKTVVKCQKGDKFDPEKGLAMAIVKKQCGHNHGYFNRIFQKWCPDEEPEDIDIPKRPKVFTEAAEEYKEEVKKQKKIGDGYDDIRWETNGRIVRK